MATSITVCQETVGLILICSEIISDEQRNESIFLLDKALKRIDTKKFGEIETVFNNLLEKNDFDADCQYRQIAEANGGSIVGFLYLPNFHAFINVLKDFFTHCDRLSIICVGQQIDSNGALILSDSLLLSDHIHQLFEKELSFVTQHIQIILPFISHQWSRLATNYLQKRLKSVQFDDLSTDSNENHRFGNDFYQKFVEIFTRPTVNVDIYSKLVARDRAGTIAFDEPNLYILYGQQGEASLFGIRGFVVLINGGFSRIPSYWNLIRGLQVIDACVLTHFDYDVFPGLQTLLHRKTIPNSDDGQLCKPEIGALFLNQIQRARLQSPKRVSNSKLAVNLSQNIDQFLNDVKKLNIDTFDLIKNITTNKPTIEPINLYKKIAFGSLDLYVLYPTSLSAEDEKMLATVQKIPIRDQQPSPSAIPLHHWYSSCTLLVWTPTGKSSKDTLVRILYTAACPQTLVFEALTRVRHLDLLHESQQSTSRLPTGKSHLPSTSINTAKTTTQKPKSSSAKPTVTSTTIRSDKLRSAPLGTTSVKRTSIGKNSAQSGQINRKTQINTSKSADIVSETQNHEVESIPDGSDRSSSSTDLVAINEQQSISSEHSVDLKRPESVPLSGEIDEYFVESSAATPIDETHCHSFPIDPMTISFVDGAPNTKNPFLDKTDDEQEMKIIHHTITETNEELLSLTEEIHPQGLPFDDEQQIKKVAIKKAINQTRRSTTPSISTTQIKKTKQTVAIGPIFYVDVAFIPYHGNEHYVDSEFFRRIRARYYVLNAVEINRLTLESLLDGKQQWETQDKSPVTLVPTYDGDQLRQFFVANKTRLAELNINIIAASIRCNVQYDDDGSPAQRLRFTVDQ